MPVIDFGGRVVTNDLFPKLSLVIYKVADESKFRFYPLSRGKSFAKRKPEKYTRLGLSIKCNAIDLANLKSDTFWRTVPTRPVRARDKIESAGINGGTGRKAGEWRAKMMKSRIKRRQRGKLQMFPSKTHFADGRARTAPLTFPFTNRSCLHVFLSSEPLFSLPLLMLIFCIKDYIF